VIVILLVLAAFCLFIWWSSELQELWIGAIVLIPLIQHLI
jgi:hypothetical protein